MQGLLRGGDLHRNAVSQNRQAKLKSSDIHGLKHFAKIRDLLRGLHASGCQRDKAGNRHLHMDEYCLGVLLFLFNPAITSLRAIQQASGFRNVQKKLGIRRASLGSLSESVSVFDPEPLKQIAAELATEVPRGQGADFSAVHQRITAVDGSVFDTVARVAELSWLPLVGGSTGPSSDGKLRIATNLSDVPAELISKLYRLRWLIELFFRMFKGLFGCSHLLSTKQNGVEIQAYMAIIACLLILIYTGINPNKRLFEAICLYLQGWVELDELEALIEKQRAAAKKKNVN